MKFEALFAWTAKLLAALSLLYTALFAASSLGITFFSLESGGMFSHAVSPVLLSSNIDHAIWLAAVLFDLAFFFYRLRHAKAKLWLSLILLFTPLLLVGSLLLFGFTPLALSVGSLIIFFLFAYFPRESFKASTLTIIKDLMLSAAAVLLLVQVCSLAASIALIAPFVSSLSPSFLAEAHHWILVDQSFADLFYPLLPAAYLFFVFLGLASILVKLNLFQRLLDRTHRQTLCKLIGISWLLDIDQKDPDAPFGFLNRRIFLALAILASFAVSVILVIITVLPWINPTFRLVSVDAPFYYQWIHTLRTTNFSGAMTLAFGSDRPLFLVLMYALSWAFSPLTIVQLFPILLLPIFSVFCIWLTKTAGGQRESWIYAAFLAPVSIQALGLIFSGYLANMFGLFFVYLYYAAFLWATQKSKTAILPLLGVSVLLIFAYPWAWFILALSLLVYLFMQWRAATLNHNLWSSFKTKTFLVGISLLGSVLFDFVRRLLVTASSVVTVSGTVAKNLTFPNPALLWNGMNATADFYLGGAFGSQLLLFLAILGFLWVLKSKSEMSSLLTSWVFVSCLAILFTNSEFAYHKFLFSMPLAVFSSLGLSMIVRFTVKNQSHSKIRIYGSLLLISTVTLLILLCSALRFVSNLTVP